MVKMFEIPVGLLTYYFNVLVYLKKIATRCVQEKFLFPEISLVGM